MKLTTNLFCPRVRESLNLFTVSVPVPYVMRFFSRPEVNVVGTEV
jgi:hypothetical protein